MLVSSDGGVALHSPYHRCPSHMHRQYRQGNLQL